MIINQLVPQASTYAKDIDFVFEFIFWVTGFWTILCFAIFFGFIFKFRAKDGVKAQYLSGETKEEKKARRKARRAKKRQAEEAEPE